MRRNGRVTATAVCTLSAWVTVAGCGSESASDPAPETPSPATLELVADIGCVDCEGPEAFGLIRDAAVMEDSAVVVLTAEDPKVRIFGLAGEPPVAFGREGDGPGELRRPTNVAYLPDQGIVVVDRQHGPRVFSEAGDLLWTAEEPLPFATRKLHTSPSGAWMLQYGQGVFPDRQIRARTWDSTLTVRSIVTPDSAVSEGTEDLDSDIYVFEYAIADDGTTAVGHAERYRILFYDTLGNEVGQASRDIPRRPRTPEEIAEIESRMLPPLPIPVPEGVTPPEPPAASREYTHFGAFDFDGQGRLWVWTPRGLPDYTVFDLFGPDRRYLGEVTLPRRLYHPMSIGREILIGLEEDDFGVDHILAWRIGPPRG